MFRSLATAASGMQAQQTRLDVTSHNIANVSTNGYKRERAEFADLMYQNLRPAGAATGNGAVAPTNGEVGLGVRLVSTSRETAQGELQQSNNPLDVAIEGNGYLPIVTPSGETQYTRNGSLQLTSEGKLVTSDGYAVLGDITIPADAQNLAIAGDGTVTATLAGSTATTELGKIQIATFTNPGGLAAQGSTLYRETTASGSAVLGTPGEGGAGTLRQSMLETSNVNVVSEMIDLIAGQRAYEINSRVIKAADEMLGDTAQLK
jgi:flagellar basal-body rod protein FlgG